MSLTQGRGHAAGRPVDRLVHRATHPSFTDAVGHQVVCGLSIPELREVWRVSGAALSSTTTLIARANLALLRSIVMDALEDTDPGFMAWLLVQPLAPPPTPC